MTIKTRVSTESHPYAPSGLMGLMVPYGNFATEWEVSLLLGQPYFAITTRLTGCGSDISSRLAAYFEPDRLSAAVATFGSTPLETIGIACSATSYIIGREREQEIFKGLADKHQQAFSWSTEAIRAALQDMDERRFTLVSPYAPSMTEACARYWEDSGYTVEHIEQITNTSPGFHPIYTIAPDAVDAALANARERSDAPIIITGTGLSTLPAVWTALARGGDSSSPILPANLALVRHMLRAANDVDLSIDAWFTPAASWLEPVRRHPRMQEIINA